MNDSQTNFDYLDVLLDEEKKKELRDKTCSAFAIPSHGVVLFFDVNNYPKSPENSIWRSKAFYKNIKKDGLLGQKPPQINNIINEIANILQNYSHLIWISRRAWDTSDIEFVWYLSHELQHLTRDRVNHKLPSGGEFLQRNRNLPGMNIDESALQTTIPTEMDAYLASWRTVQRLLGKEKANKYILQNTQNGELKASFQTLQNHGLEQEYDVYSETINILQKHQSKLDEIIKDNKVLYRNISSIDSLISNLKS